MCLQHVLFGDGDTWPAVFSHALLQFSIFWTLARLSPRRARSGHTTLADRRVARTRAPAPAAAVAFAATLGLVNDASVLVNIRLGGGAVFVTMRSVGQARV